MFVSLSCAWAMSKRGFGDKPPKSSDPNKKQYIQKQPFKEGEYTRPVHLSNQEHWNVLLRPPYLIAGNSYVFFGMKWLRRSWYFCSSERYCLLENVPTSCLDSTEAGWKDEAGLRNVFNSDFSADCPLDLYYHKLLLNWNCDVFRAEYRHPVQTFVWSQGSMMT